MLIVLLSALYILLYIFVFCFNLLRNLNCHQWRAPGNNSSHSSAQNLCYRWGKTLLCSLAVNLNNAFKPCQVAVGIWAVAGGGSCRICRYLSDIC